MPIICADCVQHLPKIAENSVHLIVTDPPYFLDGLDNEWRKGAGKAAHNTGVIGKLPVGMKFDAKQGKRLQSFIEQVSRELKRVLVPGGFFLCFSQPRLVHRMATGIEDAGFEIRDLYAWRFTHPAQMKAFSQTHFVEKMNKTELEKTKILEKLQGRKTPQLRPQYESIILAQNPKQGTFVDNWLQHGTGLVDTTQTLDGTAPSTVMCVEKPTGAERTGHMTPKPLALLRHLIQLFSTRGQVVLDPFLGSGSTAIAAQGTERKYIGIEINEKYAKRAKERMLLLQAYGKAVSA